MTRRILYFVCIGLIAAFIVWALAGAAEVEMQHNREQVAECRALGGFARTSVDGRLSSCTFPERRR